MCGIVGLAGVEDASLVRRMAGAVAHRGPDGEGFFVGDGVSLGMRRLGIIDPAGSDQPIGNEDGSVLTIFNGEVYNYRQLRPFLEKHGHRFGTAGDTETVVHLYEEYGDAGVHLLRGMFAYAIWDRRRRRLLLTRDRLGIKPLYYAQAGRAFAFASEVKALLAVPDVARALDPVALAQYLTLQYVPGPATIVQAIRKLPPGHALTWQDGRVEVRPYWDLVLDAGERRLDDEATAAEELRGLLEESIAHHRISDVPLGVLLSGGVDSAAVTALLARVSSRVKTFTVGFDVGVREGELSEARLVARHLGTDHHELVMGPALADALPRIVRMQDEPLGDPAAIPTFFVCRFAARSVKVVLTGEGGDEVLGGYPRYGWLRLGERLRGWPGLAAAASRLLRAVPRQARNGRVGRRVSALTGAAPLEDRHLTWVATMSDDVQHELTGAAGWSATRGIVRGLLHRMGAGDPVHDLMYLDVKTWLPDDVLVKTDRMSMAASIEARVPFLDHRVVEFAASLPASVKVRSLGTKALLRRALGRDLPSATLGRRKRAFLVPLRHWLGGELRELLHDTLTSGAARARGLFRAEAVLRLLEEHGTGRHDHSRALWTLLCLELWLRNVLDAPAAAHD
jgi:asparagine synthase (glutamine-hydrolysing)